MSATETPAWLTARPASLCTCESGGHSRRTPFVEKTLTGFSGLVRQALFSEDVARTHGLLQGLDARVKLAGLVTVLVGVGLVHHLASLAVAYLAVLVLAALSAVPLGFFVKRVWMFIPLFTLVVVLPATLSVVTPGDVVLGMWTWHGTQQGLTAQGLQAAALIVARVAVSVSLAVLVTLTTPWARLLGGLRGLGVPRMFVLVVNMAYRYIFLLLDTVTDMFQSRRARTLGRIRHDRSARAMVGASAGALLGKAGHLADEVHQAMVARGYRGDVHGYTTSRLRVADGLALAAAVAAAVLLVGGDRFLVG
jgi:cobalt ECF transporter T component CbiQ